MKEFVARQQVSLFVILTFALSWYPWYAGLGAEVLAIGPSLAAFIVVLITDGKRGLVTLVRPFGRWRASLGWWGIAILGMPAIYLAGLGMHLAMGGTMPPFTMIREEAGLVPLYLLVVLAPWNGPVGEEFGWRGFALPRLQTRFGPLALLWHICWRARIFTIPKAGFR